jgi:hypothetical protein
MPNISFIRTVRLESSKEKETVWLHKDPTRKTINYY